MSSMDPRARLPAQVGPMGLGILLDNSVPHFSYP